MYRHPCTQHSEFNDEYLKPLSEKLVGENNEVMFLGNFNTDLLKYDSNKDVSDFLDIIYSTNLLSNITSPTRLIIRSQTFIHNISLHKNEGFPLKISSVNVTRSAGNCGFGHIC